MLVQGGGSWKRPVCVARLRSSWSPSSRGAGRWPMLVTAPRSSARTSGSRPGAGSPPRAAARSNTPRPARVRPCSSSMAPGAASIRDSSWARGCARAGFRVIAPSRFGYLRTPLPADASAAAQADAHACLLDALGVEARAIVGVSAGGPSVLQFALRHPDRAAALLLLVPAVYAPPSDQGRRRGRRTTMLLLFDTALRSDFLFWAASQVAHDTFVRSILGTPPELRGAARPRRSRRGSSSPGPYPAREPAPAGAAQRRRVVSALPAMTWRRSPRPRSRSAPPTISTARSTARATRAVHVPHARFIGYPSGGHMLVGRNADAFAEITAFLNAAAAKKRLEKR